jgi:hypothetical protein
MSQLISRILLTTALFPSAVLVLAVLFVLMEPQMRDQQAIVLATLIACAYMIGYWLILWRRSVVWTAERGMRTFFAGGIAVGVALGVGLAINAVVRYADGLPTVLGSLCGTVFWIIATIVVWRETAAERADRLSRASADALVCPSCGYNLTGLREARCPECGASFTISELLAAQPSRAVGEVEQV